MMMMMMMYCCMPKQFKLKMRGNGQHTTSAYAPAKLGGYWTKVNQIYIVGGVNARIHVAILPSVVECQRTE